MMIERYYDILQKRVSKGKLTKRKFSRMVATLYEWELTKQGKALEADIEDELLNDIWD